MASASWSSTLRVFLEASDRRHLFYLSLVVYWILAYLPRQAFSGQVHQLIIPKIDLSKMSIVRSLDNALHTATQTPDNWQCRLHRRGWLGPQLASHRQSCRDTLDRPLAKVTLTPLCVNSWSWGLPSVVISSAISGNTPNNHKRKTGDNKHRSYKVHAINISPRGQLTIVALVVMVLDGLRPWQRFVMTFVCTTAADFNETDDALIPLLWLDLRTSSTNHRHTSFLFLTRRTLMQYDALVLVPILRP